jgi:hypothetical protein
MGRHPVSAAREGFARSDDPAPSQTIRRPEQCLHSRRSDPVVIGQDENRLIVICHRRSLAVDYWLLPTDHWPLTTALECSERLPNLIAFHKVVQDPKFFEAIDFGAQPWRDSLI